MMRAGWRRLSGEDFRRFLAAPFPPPGSADLGAGALNRLWAARAFIDYNYVGWVGWPRVTAFYHAPAACACPAEGPHESPDHAAAEAAERTALVTATGRVRAELFGDEAPAAPSTVCKLFGYTRYPSTLPSCYPLSHISVKCSLSLSLSPLVTCSHTRCLRRSRRWRIWRACAPYPSHHSCACRLRPARPTPAPPPDASGQPPSWPGSSPCTKAVPILRRASSASSVLSRVTKSVPSFAGWPCTRS